MNFTTFEKSLLEETPSASLNVYLQSLWYFGKGEWDKSHDLIQHLPDQTAAHIHAFLHRQEGDDWNAEYWYRQAGKVKPNMTIQEEWQSIVTDLLASSKII